jgi:hypothetical protein
MATRRNKNSKRKINGKKNRTQKKHSGKKWETAIDAAQTTLNKTGSLNKARVTLRKQALYNARRLFGAVNT